MRWTELALIPTTFAIMAEVQWVVSAGGSVWVSITTRSVTLEPSGRMREGRVLSRRRPSYPSCMKRSCQRQTQVFDLPVRRMISLVPIPSPLNRTISARQTCLCGVLRSRTSTFRRRRSAGLSVMGIPVRIRQTRMRLVRWESPPGFKCQTRSTSLLRSLAENLVRRRRDDLHVFRDEFPLDVLDELGLHARQDLENLGVLLDVGPFRNQEEALRILGVPAQHS